MASAWDSDWADLDADRCSCCGKPLTGRARRFGLCKVCEAGQCGHEEPPVFPPASYPRPGTATVKVEGDVL